MAINIKFDLMGNPEPPTIVLAKRNGDKLGQLYVDPKSIELGDKLNDTSEITFALNKYVDNKITNLWDDVVDFKLIHCKEWDMWFEIKVELDEETETIKTVFCTQLGQAELSQIMIYNMTINQEGDTNWTEDTKVYKKTILFNPNDTNASLLHRILKDKAPHYSIIHVDSTIANIQRMFDFDGVSIHDAFMEIAEEIGCLFVYHSNSKDGKLQRTISVYDLQQNCQNLDCSYRGEFIDECPKCGSKNIKYGYGQDTTIFITNDELASGGIQLTTDTDSVKNCFKLEAGDDLMTATIRNCNPNGTDYIWYFSEDVKSDMPKELVDKINAYDKLYDEYYNNYSSNIDVSSYNALVNKYKAYNKDLQTITTPIKGYSALMNAYYNTVDLALYLESGLMPSVEIAETNAAEQVALLTSASLSPVAVNVKDINSVSLATADSAVLSMAKVIVKSTFKVEVDSSSISNDKTTWTGKFIVTNYSDEEDTATSGTVTVKINNDTEKFIQQKINKTLNKENTDDLSISGLFAKDYTSFCADLKKYALNPLTSFYKACDACLSILQEQGVSSKETWSDDTQGSNANLYEKLYTPYYNKSQAIASEIKTREDEIAIIKGVYETDKNENEVLKTKGIEHYINECKNTIQDALNFESYIGADLWRVFCSYRREDKYSNDNYISDGLNNAELFDKAKEFIEVAENEIYKSAELQHSISTTLNNLLAIEKFKPLVDYFSVGNWMRVRVNDEVYKLRLLDYSINYGSFDTIPVTFSDVTKIKTGISDIQSVLSQASSMATSYSSVQKQAKQGDDAKGTVDQWLSNGLNSALVRIQSNNTEDIVLDRNGLLCRSYDDITETYDPEQFRITHNIMAFTNDNWKTTSTALGKHSYRYWNGTKFADGEDYGLSTKFVTAGYVSGSQIIGGEIVSSNYEPNKSGTYLNLIDGDFSFGGGKFVYSTSTNNLSLNGVTINWETTNTPDTKDISGLEEYLNQLDGRIQTYSQTNDPSVDWKTETEKSNHIGDLWFNPDDGSTKRWTGTSWEVITDEELKQLAQSKAQIFTTTPTPPYYIGDLWVQGSGGDIMNCIYKRTEGQYVESDWVKSSKYTDDAVAKEALEQAKKALEEAGKGISLANSAQSSAKIAEENAKKYTDDREDALIDAYETYTNTQIGQFDSYVAKYLGLGGGTIVGETYIISPVIEGGYLNITNTDNQSRVIIDPNNLTRNGYIFQVHNGSQVAVGIDTSGNAEFAGKIYAEAGGTIGGFNIASTNLYKGIDSLSSENTEGVYIGTDGIRLGADFKVTSDGKLYTTKIYLDKDQSFVVDGFLQSNANIYSKANITSDKNMICNGLLSVNGVDTVGTTENGVTTYKATIYSKGYIQSDEHIYSKKYIQSVGNMVCGGDMTIDGSLCAPTVYKNKFTAAANVHVSDKGYIEQATGGSSRLLKHDIKFLEDNSLKADRLYDLSIYQGKYNSDYLSKDDCRYLQDMPMFVIEEMNDIYPIAIDKFSDDVKTWAWNPRFLIPPMLKLIQDQKKQIDNSDKNIDELKQLVLKLQNEIKELKS